MGMTARRAAGRHILYDNTGRITAILRNGNVSFFAVQIDIIDSACRGNGAGIDAFALMVQRYYVCLLRRFLDFYRLVRDRLPILVLQSNRNRPRRAAQPRLKALQIGVTAVFSRVNGPGAVKIPAAVGLLLFQFFGSFTKINSPAAFRKIRGKGLVKIGADKLAVVYCSSITPAGNGTHLSNTGGIAVGNFNAGRFIPARNPRNIFCSPSLCQGNSGITIGH